MTNLLVTDVLVVGEGRAGQPAALAASVEGRKVVMLGDGRPPSTAVSPRLSYFCCARWLHA
jgi:succinate dehydrogenase / fumarate reductase, flavoprotein subunit